VTQTLEPAPTKFDKRVLAALDPEPDYIKLGHREREWRNAWQIAELIREDDVALVRRTLRGLDHLGYCWSRKYDWRQEWVATWRAREALDASG
jgi:hypothetical protein